MTKLTNSCITIKHKSEEGKIICCIIIEPCDGSHNKSGFLVLKKMLYRNGPFDKSKSTNAFQFS